jgi:hypothetical protein
MTFVPLYRRFIGGSLGESNEPNHGSPHVRYGRIDSE